MSTESTTANDASNEEKNRYFLKSHEADSLSSRIYHFLQIKTKSEVIVLKRESSKKGGFYRLSVSILPIPERPEQERIFNFLDEFVKQIDSSFCIEQTKNLTILYLDRI